MEAESAQVVNIHSEPVSFQISTIAGARPMKFRLAPGESAEVAPAYAIRPPGAPGAAPRRSVVEELTDGRVVPAEDEKAKAVLRRRSAKKEP